MARQTHGRPVSSAGAPRAPKRKSANGRNLDAFAIAQQETSTRLRIRPNRLGEIVDEGRGISRRGTREDSADDRPTKRRKNNTQGSPAQESAEDASDGLEWHVGVDDDDEDSDLDSENAMGESDEERFEGFAFGGSKAQSSRKPLRKETSDGVRKSENINLDEPSQDDASTEDDNQSTDDELGEGAVDLATALDMNEEYEDGKQQQKMPESQRFQDTGDHHGSSDEEQSSSEDEHSALSFSDDEDPSTNHARLKSFVLDLQGRTASDVPPKRSRPPVAVGEPSDHGLASSKKLTIADLLPTVTDPRLRESLKMLHNSEREGSKPLTKGIPGKLQPPLPKRQQDRLDREAAYDKSKETMSRWIDTVKQNRRAEHISFPLSDPNALAALGTNQLMPVSQSEAITPLESAIQSIMQESGLVSNHDTSAETRMQAFEELQEKKIPIEEAQVRRAELRKMRDLMFREEVRARRIKKIKSKAYRRVHRKERDKLAQEERAALAAAGALDSEHERERQDRRRAEERMGARHKESRWAKGMKASGRTIWDEDVRFGVKDLTRRDEELRKRIDGQAPNQSDGSGEDPSDGDSSDDISIDGYDEVQEQKLNRKLEELEGAAESNTAGSRLSSMPFMRKAESARRAANQAEIKETRVLLAGEGEADEDEEKGLAEAGGRRRFGSGPQSRTESESLADKKNEFEEPLSDDAEGEVNPAEKQRFRSAQEPAEKSEKVGKLATNRPNGRRKRDDLEKSENIGKLATNRPRSGGKRDDLSSTAENPWLSGPQTHRSDLIRDEPIIPAEALLHIHDAPPIHAKNKQLASKARLAPQAATQRLTDPSDSEDEKLAADYEPESHRNEELVRMAFAGDDVFQAFADEKTAAVDEEGDQVVDNTLPGWGSWTGAGISKKEQKRANSRKSTTTVPGIEPSKRKDAKLDRVIINERRSKKVKTTPVVERVIFGY